jgi:hypothetical protein
MSEALSSNEIEDVLSSIRRLVSDDMRPVPTAQTATTTEANKLLLTPSLRVVHPAQGGEQPVEIDAVVASVGAGVAQHSGEWESETGDELSLPSVAEEIAALDWQDHQIEDYAGEAAPMVDAAEPEPAEEVLVQASFASSRTNALPGWAQTEGAEEAEAPADALWIGGTVEPDRAWADEAEAAVVQELTGGALPNVKDDDQPEEDLLGAEVPVDAAMLREIVRDVLREELQGRLGERITRNIRKLVRAEIARVMASEDFS